MTTRTPSVIFDEVVDLWDDLKRAGLLSGRVPGGLDDAWFEAEMTRHLAQVRAYREEFREAMLRPCEHGPGQVCRECRGPHELVGTGSGTVVLSYDARGTGTITCPKYREDIPGEVYQQHIRYCDGSIVITDHESVPDRAERHAARYTKDDGSAK